MKTYLGINAEVFKLNREATRLIFSFGEGRFLLRYPFLNGGTGFELEMNFSPFEPIFDLTPPYSLIHWQAAPKGFRIWGVYRKHNPHQDDYISFFWEQMPELNFPHKFLQIDEDISPTRPTAVVCYPGTILIPEGI